MALCLYYRITQTAEKNNIKVDRKINPSFRSLRWYRQRRSRWCHGSRKKKPQLQTVINYRNNIHNRNEAVEVSMLCRACCYWSQSRQEITRACPGVPVSSRRPACWSLQSRLQGRPHPGSHRPVNNKAHSISPWISSIMFIQLARIVNSHTSTLS